MPIAKEGFRDIKTLFGFKDLILKGTGQTRFDLLFLLVIIPYANSNMTLLVAHLWERLYKLVVNDYLM